MQSDGGRSVTEAGRGGTGRVCASTPYKDDLSFWPRVVLYSVPAPLARASRMARRSGLLRGAWPSESRRTSTRTSPMSSFSARRPSRHASPRISSAEGLVRCRARCDLLRGAGGPGRVHVAPVQRLRQRGEASRVEPLRREGPSDHLHRARPCLFHDRSVQLTASDREDDMRPHLQGESPKFLGSMPIEKAIARLRQ